MFKINRKILFKLLSLIVIVPLIVSGCSAQNKAKERDKKTNNEKALSAKINADADKYAKTLNFNGAVLVAKNGKVILHKAYGMSNVEQKTPNTTQTKFLLGSITKQFTSLSIMQLEEKGLLSVNDTVDKYIPGFPHGKEITIHQLLSHTSGLPRDIQTEVKFDTMPSSLEEAINIVKGKDIKLLCNPGESFNYSNSGYILLGYILEKVSGEKYSDYLQNHIFTPLKMNNSGFGYDRNKNKNLALGYSNGLKVAETPKDFYDLSIVAFSAGGIYSTIDDLYKWDRALYTEKLVKKKTLSKIYTPVKDNYGYGWFISKKTYFHNGDIGGFHTEIIRQVDNDACIIVLSNEENDSYDYLATQLGHSLIYGQGD